MARTTRHDTVVIIDDEVPHVQWLADHLEGQGFKTQFASSVQQALELVRGEIFRALIVDLNIPADERTKQELRTRDESY